MELVNSVRVPSDNFCRFGLLLGTRAPFGMEKLSKRLLTAKQYDCQKMRRQNTSQELEAIITNLKFYELDKFKVLLPTSFQLLPTNLQSQEVHIRHMGWIQQI